MPRERELDSDFIFDIDDTRSMFSEPAPQCNTKYRKAVQSLERYRTDDYNHARSYPNHEEYHLQPLLRVRSLKAIDHHTLSAPSSPVLQPRYRSYERSNMQTKRQSINQQTQQDKYHSTISKSASLPNGGFPVQPPIFVPQQPVLLRERVIDRHIAERSSSRGESHRQQQQESAGSYQARSSKGQQSDTLNRSLPVRYETANASSASASYRQSNGYKHEPYPTYFSNEQNTSNSYRQQNIGPHPQRIVN